MDEINSSRILDKMNIVFICNKMSIVISYLSFIHSFVHSGYFILFIFKENNKPLLIKSYVSRFPHREADVLILFLFFFLFLQNHQRSTCYK